MKAAKIARRRPAIKGNLKRFKVKDAPTALKYAAKNCNK